jgi:hypothetical protein
MRIPHFVALGGTTRTESEPVAADEIAAIATAIATHSQNTPQNAQGSCAKGMPATFMPSRPVMKVSGRNTIAADGDDQRALVDLLGAQIGERLVGQRGALADALQLLGHARGAIGGGGQMEPVVVAQPVAPGSRELLQRGALRHQEAAIGDRLAADRD